MAYEMGEHPDNLQMVRAVNRYKERFEVVHGGRGGESESSDYVTDYKMYGDLIEPDVLNAWNLEASKRYVQMYVDRMAKLYMTDRMKAMTQALEELEPVMCGFFEHAFLLGMMYVMDGTVGEGDDDVSTGS